MWKTFAIKNLLTAIRDFELMILHLKLIPGISIRWIWTLNFVWKEYVETT